VSEHKHGKEYVRTVIRTVRQHEGHMNAWPSWSNILADEIEDSWAEVERQRARAMDLVHAIYQWRCQGQGEPLTLERVEEMVAALAAYEDEEVPA
jgi:hypothetical protein